MENLFSLQGKTAWVTGAAYGIGFAIAEALADAGARIVYNYGYAETHSAVCGCTGKRESTRRAFSAT